MSDLSREETRASEENVEKLYRSPGCAPDVVEIPRTDHSHGDLSEAVPSVGDDQWQERRMPPGGCHPHITREYSQVGAFYRELGGQPEWEARSEWRDERAFFPGSQFEDGVAVAGSGHAGGSGAEGLSEGAILVPPCSRRSVPERSHTVEEGLPRTEPEADRQRCHRRPCRRAAREERELGPSCYSYPHLGGCEWSWGRPGATSPCQLAADCQRCHRRPCHLTVRVELELWPSCSSYPDLGPYEWRWGRPRSTSRCRDHCPRYHRTHRF